MDGTVIKKYIEIISSLVKSYYIKYRTIYEAVDNLII